MPRSPTRNSSSTRIGSTAVFRTKGGSLAIQDGHHRIARAAAEGRQTARVRFIDLYTPPHPTNQLNLF
jgi:hypothetical protein